MEIKQLLLPFLYISILFLHIKFQQTGMY